MGFQEKIRLEEKINSYKKELEDKDKEYDILLKRYKVLELSIKDRNKDSFIAMRPNNIKLKLKSKKKNKQTWSATLPTSLSPQKIMNFLDDFSGKWSNKQNEEKREEKIDEIEIEDKKENGNEEATTSPSTSTSTF